MGICKNGIFKTQKIHLQNFPANVILIVFLFWLKVLFFDWIWNESIKQKRRETMATIAKTSANIKWKHLFNRTQFPVSTPLFSLNKIQRSISIRTHSVKDKLYCLLLVHKVKEWLKSWERNLFSAFELILWIRKDKCIFGKARMYLKTVIPRRSRDVDFFLQ